MKPGYQEIADSLRVCGTGGGNCDGCFHKDSEGLCSQLLKKQGAEAIESLLKLVRELAVAITQQFPGV